MKSASWLVKGVRVAGAVLFALMAAGALDGGGVLHVGHAQTQVAQAGAPFDHLRTGFQLTGSHVSQRCESCHLGGVFKGTPRDCASCHTAGARYARNNIVKPVDHVPTQQACDVCHNTSTFVNARFDHSGVRPGTCATCHNGTTATGKTATHITTTASCDSCHRTTAWVPAMFNHASVAAGSCATCHNGTNATGKPPAHIPTTASCDTCHSTTTWTTATFNHQGVVAGSCATCHNGTLAKGNSTPPHIPTTAACDACHSSTTTFTTATMNHTIVAATPCATCHNGAYTGEGNNGGAKAMSSQPHIPTTAACSTCHTNTTTWLPVPATYGHTGIAAGSCSSCHGGTYTSIDVKPAGHITTTASCDSCHSTSTWSSATFNHQGVVAGTCATCHNGTQATGKTTPPHIPTTASCDACHTSTTTFTTATMNHTIVAGTPCATCHNGAYTGEGNNGGAKAMTSQPHIPTTASCDTCHTNTSTWLPVPPTYGHAGVAAGTCATCHGGTYTNIDVKVAGHITTTPANQSCDACHTTATWTTATFNHQGVVAGTCATCHNGTQATGKTTPPHIPTTASCDACHTTTTTFTTATMNHTIVAGTPCATCHNGAYAGEGNNGGAKAMTSQPHIPTTASCDTCHTNTTTWLPVPPTYGHAGIAAGSCSSCHGGTYTSIDVKPAGHIATTASCDSCHTTATWTTATFNHQGVVAGTCATCHNGTSAMGKTTPPHIPTTASCDACHTSTTTFTTATMNHTIVAGTPCATCHNGAYTGEGNNGGAKAMTSQPHIPTTAACDTCHTNTSTWLPVPPTYGHVGIAVGSCSTCHGGTYTSIDIKPAGHIATTSSCDACHRTTTWTGATFNHQGVVAGTCATCHNGTTATGKTTPPHIPTTASCDACHTSTTTFTTATMNHTVVTGTTCKTCHNGAYTSEGTTGALAEPSNHIPEATQLLNGSTLDCNACHTTTTAWTSERMNHNGSQGNGSGWCKGCHQSGTSFLGKMQKMALNHRNRTPAPTDCSQSGCHRPIGNTGSTYSEWD